MPLTKSEREAMDAMQKEYGEKEGEGAFYASKNKGRSFAKGSDNSKAAMAQRKQKGVKK